MQTELLKLIEKFNVVSFDIFDTLLLRPYLKPTDLFERVEAESGSVGFSFARQRADYKSVMRAQGAGRDAMIDDAYELMPGAFRSMRDRELELEREGLVANAEMLEVWNRVGQMGKKRVIASDMYLPRSFLESVLRERGIDGWDGFYLSCDCGVRKSTGKMYELILREQNIRPERMLHVGDNPDSDVVMPSSLGIQTWMVEKVVDRLVLDNPFQKRFLEMDGSLEARRLVASVCVGWHNYAATHLDSPYWAKIGGLLGSVFGAAYVAFLAREIRERMFNRVLFVARDGFVLEKLFNAVLPDIKTNYVYAPRLVKNSDDPNLREEYARYIKQLEIGASESVAVVDSISLNFSAQKLIGEALKRPVFNFSFVALKKPVNGVGYLYAPRMSLRWCHLVEQFFMAEEPPIEFVVNGSPVYKSYLPDEERNRIGVFHELAAAEIDVAKFLLRNKEVVTSIRLLDYIDAFVDSMTDEDTAQFETVKNSNDTHSEDYAPIISPDRHWKTAWRTFKKIPIYKRFYGRKGLKMMTHDKFLGLFEFRKIEEDL